MEKLRELSQLKRKELYKRKKKITKRRDEKGYGRRSITNSITNALIKKEGVPKYLKKGWKESRWQRVARFKLGNGMKRGRYWKTEERIKYKIRRRREET
ncbi:hypothetical protein ALC57_02417 [Trachymyrmex cornetzi]|uniref:Uncharacterized protein n=1 Tax=Trachymyrmex cornetzi TaxID=471704 RepID=A0A151JNT6_9HYME|nr:hypothetical protein ALC57_02417 [Trachymyrmex cornetzi]